MHVLDIVRNTALREEWIQSFIVSYLWFLIFQKKHNLSKQPYLPNTKIDKKFISFVRMLTVPRHLALSVVYLMFTELFICGNVCLIDTVWRDSPMSLSFTCNSALLEPRHSCCYCETQCGSSQPRSMRPSSSHPSDTGGGLIPVNWFSLTKVLPLHLRSVVSQDGRTMCMPSHNQILESPWW